MYLLFRSGEGVVEFGSKGDMEYAVDKLDGAELGGRRWVGGTLVDRFTRLGKISEEHDIVCWHLFSSCVAVRINSIPRDQH